MKNAYGAALAFAAGFAGLSAAPVHAADANLARNLAATCANCHGTNGKSLGGMESLAGVEKDKLVDKLKEFRSGAKPATIMHQISKGYSEEQLDLIAAWFAAQK
jgi:cytochrome c553